MTASVHAGHDDRQLEWFQILVVLTPAGKPAVPSQVEDQPGEARVFFVEAGDLRP
jgi:hypothetical protein